MEALDRLDARGEETPALGRGRWLARADWCCSWSPWPLSTGCASIVVYNRPVLDRGLQDVVAGTTPPPAESLALVQAGMALDRKHPEWAMTYYRDAALKALPQVESEGVSPKLDLAAAKGAQGIYRRSIEYILETANRRAKAEGVSWTDVLARAGIGVRGKVHLYETAMWEEALPTRQFEIKGIRHRAGRGGLGAPSSFTWIDHGNKESPRPRPAAPWQTRPWPTSRICSIDRPRPSCGREQGPTSRRRCSSCTIRCSTPDLRWRPSPGAAELAPGL